MASRWTTSTVRELQDGGVLRVEDGNHGESRPRPNEFVEHGVAFIRASDISNSTIDFRHAERINSVARARITKGIGAPGDILFSHKGTVGKLAQALEDSPPFVCSPQTTFWRVCDPGRLDHRFLFAFMRSRLFKTQWHARKGETDMADYVSLTAQRTFSVPLPDIDEQRAIGDLLEPIDARIGTCRSYGHTLHSLAERLFRSWFVDLDLPAARDGDLLMPLERQLQALLGTIDPSSRPVIPTGWNRMPLDKIARFRNGIAMQKFPPTDAGSLPVLKIAELRDGSLDGADRVTDDLPEEVVVRDGDVIFSWSGSLMVKIWTGGTAGLNQHLFRVTSESYPKWIYYFWTRAHLAEFQAIADDKKTTMGHIKRGHLSDAITTVPDPAFMEVADSVLAPLLERYVLCHLQARRLEALRDRMLRALMSGEMQLESERVALEALS